MSEVLGKVLSSSSPPQGKGTSGQRQQEWRHPTSQRGGHEAKDPISLTFRMWDHQILLFQFLSLVF